MRVRAVEPHEWARLRELRLRALQEDPAAFGRTHAQERALPDREWQERVGLTEGAQLVAEEDDHWLGLLGIHMKEGEREFVGLWVAPEARGRAVGMALLQQALAWARQRGDERVVLWVNVAQHHAADLYARAGFVPEGEPWRSTREPVRTFQKLVRPLERR